MLVENRWTDGEITDGTRGAKFYFMIGLPLPEPAEGEGADSGSPILEEREIVDFVLGVGAKTGMHFSINVGIFVPKSHTPYQWAGQLDPDVAEAKLRHIVSRLKVRGHKVSVSDPLPAMVEGILSRGDERAGDLAEQAFALGSRLDAWREYLSAPAWRQLLEENAPLVRQFLGERPMEEKLPWAAIYPGVSLGSFKEEKEKSDRGEPTAVCGPDCTDTCGVCGGKFNVIANPEVPEAEAEPAPPEAGTGRPDPEIFRMLFSFCKEGSAVFLGHLSLIEVFPMALARADLPVLYSRGFNPLARLEIAHPLSVGITAAAEMATADFPEPISGDDFARRMNAVLPEGIRIGAARCYRIPPGSRKRSLSSLLWGFAYGHPAGPARYVPALEEKAFRLETLGEAGSPFRLYRREVLARNPAMDADGENAWASYFEVYGGLYGLP